MKRSDFHFDLPESLIAQFPPSQRRDSRLLVLSGEEGRIEDRQFSDFLDLLKPGDLLVLNDTRVIPARIWGRKATGGKVEVLVERVIDDKCLLAHVRASKAPKVESLLHFGEITARVIAREGDLFKLAFQTDHTLYEILEQIGQTPLPPYITRKPDETDRERYQTIYARHAGAVAAPTAGLHFDQAMFDSLTEKGIELGYVTLHVGAGTFQPLRVENIAEHQMHAERISVSESLCRQVEATRSRGGRVIAVGTTSVRCLETAGASGQLCPYEGETEIFITPGYSFRIVDALLTNFHLPESTLMMLVTAFGGYEQVMAAYRHAVREKYRFFSYGDAMFINKLNDTGY